MRVIGQIAVGRPEEMHSIECILLTAQNTRGSLPRHIMLGKLIKLAKSMHNLTSEATVGAC